MVISHNPSVPRQRCYGNSTGKQKERLRHGKELSQFCSPRGIPALPASHRADKPSELKFKLKTFSWSGSK
ncbi:uncharacterized [Tachysurus ichikawai]